MEIDKQLKTAGILISRDSVGVEHIRFEPGNKKRVRRFQAFQQCVLDRPPGQSGATSASLIAFELVPPTCVSVALAATPYSYLGDTYLDWTHAQDERLDRRRVSAMTRIYWNKMPADREQEWTDFSAWLCSLEGYQGMSATTAMEELERDLFSWASRHLPMPLFAHVCGLRPLTALSRLTLARGSSGLIEAVDLNERKIERESQISDFLDVVDEIDGDKCKTTDDSLVRLAVASLKTKKDESPDSAIERWVGGLLALRARVVQTNVATGITLAWMADLCESGTARKADADHLTRRRYCVATGRALWRMLSALEGHPETWDSAALNAGYLALMDDPSIRDKNGLGAGLSSFQAFLQEQWDIDLPAINLHKLIPLPRPRAQYVNTMEIHRALDWNSLQTAGDRILLDMSTLAIAMGSSAPFRLRELLYLRLCNIAPLPDGGYEIEIVRFGWRNKLKSAAAVRRVLIEDPQTIEILRSHIERRQREGASSKELLFGSPFAGNKIYRQHALHRTVLRQLKLTTGDPDMTFHALRHSWACREVAGILEFDSAVDFNRLIHISEQMGHVTPATSLLFYSHRFEDALFRHIKVALSESLTITAATGHSFTGILPNTLGTQSRRRGIDLAEVVWRSICDAGERIAFPDVANGINLILPACPILGTSLDEGLTPMKILSALQMLDNHALTDALVAARIRTTNEEVVKIRQIACDIARAHSPLRRSNRVPIAIESVSAAVAALGIDLSRARQPKFAKLCRALAVSVEPKMAAEASRSWLRLRKRGYISLEIPSHSLELLQLLKLSDIAARDLAICTQFEESTEMAERLAIAKIRETLLQVWNTAPGYFRMDGVHPARPNAYLIWPSKADSNKLQGSAATSIAGLEALLLSVTIYSILSGESHVSA